MRVPSTLLRSLAKHADDDAEDIREGVALGTHGVGDAPTALWGVLRSAPALSNAFMLCRLAFIDSHETQGYLPGGISALAQRDDSLVFVFVRSTHKIQVFEKQADGALTPVDVEVVECAHASEFMSAVGVTALRCGAQLSRSSPTDLLDEVARWQTQLSSPNSTFFQFLSSADQAIFTTDGKQLAPATNGSSNVTLKSLLRIDVGDVKKTSAKSKKSKKKAQANALDAWDADDSKGAKANSTGAGTGATTKLKTLEYGDMHNVLLLQSLLPTPGQSAAAPILTIPVASQAPSNSTSYCHVDTIVFLPATSGIQEAVVAIRDRLHAQLVASFASLESAITAGSSKASCVVSSHHVALLGACFPLTVVSIEAEDKPNEQLGIQIEAERKRLHHLFFQPDNQPLLLPQRCSLVRQASMLEELDVLINVHEGLPPSGVPQGKQYLVAGFYGYYHYMQQQMNDKGWGCAYRSLQTLASWLYLNNYSDRATLTHQDIQRTLVKIGDKPSSFVNSREWIGSMEVGYVLDELYGISFRSMHMSSGAQLVDHAQELKAHFLQQGTPVMMGGANLAFTLLGIDFNEATGECAFLILDPHYVGADDLEIIQTKTMALEGYKAVPCGWRKASSFAKNSFYNLCLPQRPQAI
ncbi:TPA: hypothetical protein N0F65_005111 [Lagenidium giganteum]|uniref:UFSP1/2/DUB catalytic domain-containing protein n=1 Tax=Lagenidium giganteum TaxID=4803 RepID=A0AAV2Z8E6_9STRA|nr:TPA: hypothetical protein N0F65_005111 [Lagenidium giganteum]